MDHIDDKTIEGNFRASSVQGSKSTFGRPEGMVWTIKDGQVMLVPSAEEEAARLFERLQQLEWGNPIPVPVAPK